MLTYYKFGHAQRKPWANVKWRVAITLLAVAGLLATQDYLYGKYGVLSTAYSPPFVLADKLFYWFVTGFLFGVIAFALITEGEYLLGLWKIAKSMEQLEKGVVRGIARGVKGVEREIISVEKGVLKEVKKEAKVLAEKRSRKAF